MTLHQHQLRYVYRGQEFVAHRFEEAAIHFKTRFHAWFFCKAFSGKGVVCVREGAKVWLIFHEAYAEPPSALLWGTPDE